MVSLLRRIVVSKEFNRLILGMIVVSGILVGFETYPRFYPDTTAGNAIQWAQQAILWVFVLEAALKIGAWWPTPWRYFTNPWNIFDFAIIAVCFLPWFLGDTGASAERYQFAMVFRMARLLRALRLFTSLPRLQILVSALLKSIPSLGYVGILLLLHFYIYAVLGTFMFKTNDPMRFGNLQRSMLTLFQVVTLEGWNDVLHAQMYGSDINYTEQWQKHPDAVGRVSLGRPAVAVAYFVSFIMLGTMIMLNLFTGVIIGSMQEAQDMSTGKTADEVEERIKELEEKGFMTVREELEVVALHLREVSAEISALREHSTLLQIDARGPSVTASKNPGRTSKE